MKKEIKDYARQILADHNCDEYTYGGTNPLTILDELKEGYPDGMKYPYVDVANAIASISKPRLIKKAKYRTVYDAESFCDGIEHDSLEAAKADAQETLIEWMTEERSEWKDVFNPTKKELDRYNHMICNCSTWVSKYNPMTDEYEEYWSPSYGDEESIGWKELTREDIAKEEADYNGWMAKDVDSSADS